MIGTFLGGAKLRRRNPAGVLPFQNSKSRICCDAKSAMLANRDDSAQLHSLPSAAFPIYPSR
jgi:hypothetical protein